MNDVIREFLLETHENLVQLDADLLVLEKEPTKKQTLASVFRTLHSVKGTAGFVGLMKLQAVAHSAESLLTKLRSGELVLNQPMATALLSVVDAIRQILASIEKNNTEGDGDYTALVAELDRLRESTPDTKIEGPTRVASSTSQFASQVSPVAKIVITESTQKPFASQESKPLSSVVLANSIVKSTVNPASDLSKSDSKTQIRSSDSAVPEVEQKSTSVADTTLRVDVGLLDKLMNLVGELVLARNQMVQFAQSQNDSRFTGTIQRLNQLTTELQTNVMKTRMQPIGNVWNKFPRVVRDLSIACGKQIKFEMEGQETELDKTIIEAIKDPLTHMIRNAVDHGIEPPDIRIANGKVAEGRLYLHAFHEGGKVIIQIVDDGGGINPGKVRAKAVQQKLVSEAEADQMSERELVNLIFLPGFSTAEKVTNFSGRGVGMDVVRTNIENIGGTVDLESRVGLGTTVRMKIPLTLAIIPAMTVSCDGDRYCIPQVSLLELLRLEGEQAVRSIEYIQGTPVYRLRGQLLPIVYLRDVLGLKRINDQQNINIVVLQADDRTFGLVVDTIHDTQEIVVKPLQQLLKGLSVYSGATILGDGQVALILDIMGVAQAAKILSNKQQKAKVAIANNDSTKQKSDLNSLLLFATPNGGRMAIPLDQVSRLEEFLPSQLEKAGNRMVVQYRGQVMPIVPITDLFNEAPAIYDATSSLPVVVHMFEGQNVGLAIGRILDVVEEEIKEKSIASRKGIQFNAVVQGKIAEFIDLDTVMKSIDLNKVNKL